MSEDDLRFVWNCCDELEKARERETVLRIASELRERFAQRERWTFQTPAGPAVVEFPVPLPAPESGVEFERPDLNDGDDFEVKP